MSEIRLADDLQHADTRNNAILALRMAFIAAAPGVLTGIFIMTTSITITRYIQMALYMPAVLMGARLWSRSTSFARSAPVIACVLMPWIGYVYASPHTSEGVEFIAQLSIVLPVAALIVEYGAWMLCVRTFIYANVPVLAMIFFVEYQKHGLNLFLGMHRFGLVYLEEEGRMVANPNSIGGQFAFVAVLALAVFLRNGTARSQKLPGRRPKGVAFGLPLIFAFASLLTGSRGASAALSAGTATLLVGGIKSQRSSRIRDMLIVGVLAASLLVTLATFDVFSVFTPWQSLANRWSAVESVDTVGQRRSIWEDAYCAWMADPFRTVFGTGTGAAPIILGQFCEVIQPNNEGQVVVGSHSVYVEWGLTFGLLGFIPGVCFLISAVRRARRLDRQDGTTTRTAILLSMGLWAAVSCIHRHPSSLATGSLMLSMLSDVPVRKRKPQPSSTEEASVSIRPRLRSHLEEPVGCGAVRDERSDAMLADARSTCVESCGDRS